jgi:hypothetical protein
MKEVITSWMNKFMKILSSQQHFWWMEVGSSRGGDGGCSSGGLHESY